MDAVFDRLEARVNVALSTIQGLRRDREELLEQRNELTRERNRLRQRIQELEAQLGKSREVVEPRVVYEKKKKAIEKRVEGLLSLFDGLEDEASA